MDIIITQKKYLDWRRQNRANRWIKKETQVRISVLFVSVSWRTQSSSPAAICVCVWIVLRLCQLSLQPVDFVRSADKVVALFKVDMKSYMKLKGDSWIRKLKFQNLESRSSSFSRSSRCLRMRWYCHSTSCFYRSSRSFFAFLASCLNFSSRSFLVCSSFSRKSICPSCFFFRSSSFCFCLNSISFIYLT